MTLILYYKDGTIRVLRDVLVVSYVTESPHVKFPGPYFYYELDIPLPDDPDCNESGRVRLDEIYSIEVFNE